MPNLALFVESCPPLSKFAAPTGQETALTLRVKTAPMLLGSSLQGDWGKSLNLSYGTNVSSCPSRACCPRLG